METSPRYWEDSKPENSSIDPTFSHGQGAVPDDATAATAVAVANGVAANGGATTPTSGPEMTHHGRVLSETKRAKQNRQAQRNFRKRKEVYIRELEEKAKELVESKNTIEALRHENLELRDYILNLQSRLLDGPGGVVPSVVPGSVVSQKKLE